MQNIDQLYREKRSSKADAGELNATHVSLFPGTCRDWPATSDKPPRSRPRLIASRFSVADALSWLTSCFIDGFAAYGEALGPGCAEASTLSDCQEGHRNSRARGYDRNEQRRDISWLAEIGPWPLAASARSVGKQTVSPVRSSPIITRFWSRVRREWQVSRVVATLRALDDRTLKDIGIHRSQIGSVARHGDFHRL
jgi:uncharacterized protein YjiS (DUF1127 family)